MIRYYISFSNPISHFIELEVKIDELSTESIELCLPAWRPGRYQIQNFAKNIRGFHITGEQGQELPFEKINKDRWLVQVKGNKSISVHYEYFAFIMDAGNSWLDDEQLYLNFINCCIYEPSKPDLPCEIHLDLPEGYQVACGLEQKSQYVLSAPNYYKLVDSPMIASPTIHRLVYEVASSSFNIWIQGEFPIDEQKVIDDFKAFTTLQIGKMGPFPCTDYHFLVQCLPYKHYHGVEHWNSTTITIGPAKELSERKLYKEFLGVSSHELFHTWNVIRLRPKEMTPYDFQQENYHKTGYVTEGITTYLGDLFLAQSGLFSPEEYLTELNKHFQRHSEAGWNNMSVSDSSFDLWLDGYEKGIPGRKVSIYTAGALAALTLDWLIRLQWNNRRSIMNVMRLMWKRYGADQSGYYADDYKEAAIEVFEENQPGNPILVMAYQSDNSCFEDYFDKQINGCSEHVNVLKHLAGSFGLDIVEELPESPEERYFGFRLASDIVSAIDETSPAFSQLSLNDKILSINELPQAKWSIDGSQQLVLEIDRYGRKLTVNLVPDPHDAFFLQPQIKMKHTMTQEERHNLKSWLEQSV